MAKVWIVKESSGSTTPEPWCEMALSDCCQKLGLTQSDFHRDLVKTPNFGNTNDPLAAYRDPQIVEIQIDYTEAEQHEWKPGFYRSKLSPNEAGQICAPFRKK